MNQWFQNSRGLVIVGFGNRDMRRAARGRAERQLPEGRDRLEREQQRGVGDHRADGSDHDDHHHDRPPHAQQGSTGADVTVLQQRLNTLGFNVGAADGSFGAGTLAAVKAFQAQKGITPADGVVNAATWAALLANA